MIETLYIGVDPDLRLLNAAIVTDQKQAIAVFKRSNKGLSDDKAVAQAVGHAVLLAGDIAKYLNIIKEHLDPDCRIVVVVESQNMEHARAMRKKGKKVKYQSILVAGQIAGIMMGALSVLTDKIGLVQPIEWKGTIPKPKAHPRYYRALGLIPDPNRLKTNIHPVNMASLCFYSADKVNKGDFFDINDSLGLALYGAKKRL